MNPIKLFEVRDRGTFIPVFAFAATKTETVCPKESYLLGRAGFGYDWLIMLGRMAGGDGSVHCDPYDWKGGARTLPVAHNYIMQNWCDLTSGDVIDVEFILGETTVHKISEAIE